MTSRSDQQQTNSNQRSSLRGVLWGNVWMDICFSDVFLLCFLVMGTQFFRSELFFVTGKV